MSRRKTQGAPVLSASATGKEEKGKKEGRRDLLTGRFCLLVLFLVLKFIFWKEFASLERFFFHRTSSLALCDISQFSYNCFYKILRLILVAYISTLRTPCDRHMVSISRSILPFTIFIIISASQFTRFSR